MNLFKYIRIPGQPGIDFFNTIQWLKRMDFKYYLLLDKEAVTAPNAAYIQKYNRQINAQ
jgi:hypothetical protein